MGTLTMFSLLVLAVVLPVCSGQNSVTVSFQMNGVDGTATFTWAQNTVTIALEVSQSLGPGLVDVEIRPIWVDYDVSDKCSDAQLGAPIQKWNKTTVFTNNTATVTLDDVESLDTLGGHSIKLTGSSNNVCASIELTQEHPTAVAQFQGLLQGTVYFRQSFNSVTRIITDLYSNQNTYNSLWFITNDVKICQLILPTTQLKPYNKNNIDTSGCSNTSATSCAVGQLSEKLGNVTIGGKRGENKFGYTDNNLPSITDINGKLLLIKTLNGSLACAAIKILEPRRSKVEFSNDGISGSITFSQASPFDPTNTSVDLQGLRYMAKGYHVHVWPTPTKVVDGQDLCGNVVVSGHLNPFNKITTSPSYPAPDTSTDDMYEVGDLSSKYGTLATKTQITSTYIDWNLPLYGSNSIIGRSVVIHHDDSTGSRWVCANIEPDNYDVKVAIAVLKYPVFGRVMFMQGAMESSWTSVFVQLDYNDGRPGTMKHKWGVRTNMVTNDMLSQDEAMRCQSTGSIYDPQEIGQVIGEPQYDAYCSINSPLGCKTGDLSGKLGLLNIRNAAYLDTATRNFFVDSNLPLSGPYSIIGKSVFIMNEAGTRILACAEIQPVNEPFLMANFSMEGLNGSISFRQKAGFGAKKTVVTNGLNLLGSNKRLYVYELPPAGNSMCSDLGNVFNPFNITQNVSATTTDDKYQVGDLGHFENMSTWGSFNLPLTGLASINQRSLVVQDQDNQNKVVGCAKIMTAGSSPIVEAVSTFTGAVTGSIHLFQTTNEDGTMSDTTIVVDLKNQDGHMSFDHNWHEHIEPVLGDADAAQGRCSSTKGHYDPYMTMVNMSNYLTECRPENPLRCELGDQSSKLGTYNLGQGKKVYTDVDLPLAGTYSGLGRSIVVHQEGRVPTRLSCADIIPITSNPVAIQIWSTTTSRRNIAQKYANAIMTDPADVVVEFISQTKDVTKLQVHFVGFNSADNRRKFISILNRQDKSILNPYAPYTGAASYSVVSATLLVAVLAVQLLNYF